jgi:hypothetical protein
MSGHKAGGIKLPQLFAPIAFLAISLMVPLLMVTAASAQGLVADEAVTADGAVSQQLALTQAQKMAIYNAVLTQRVRTASGPAGAIAAAVGAPVSPTVMLADLPDQAGSAIAPAADLKYAMVEDDVVVVDPIRMRVVGVIHGDTRP